MFKFWYQFILKAVSVIEMGQGELYYAIVGECKFKKEKIDKTICETLIRRSKLITGKYAVTHYLLFSLSGFTEWFNNIDTSNIILITLDDMYK